MAQVDVGTWTYSGDPLRADREEIRFLIGDTQSVDQLLSDQEIDAAVVLAMGAGAPAGTCSVGALTVVSTTTAGTSTITLQATTVEGTLDAGDSFVIAGSSQRYWVTGKVTADGNQFTDVTFRPALTATATAGLSVTLRLFSVREAAALCCDHLARRFAREVDVSIDGRSQNFSQKATQWAALARELRQQSRASTGSLALVRV